MKLPSSKITSYILVASLFLVGCTRKTSLPEGIEFKATDFSFASIDWEPGGERMVVSSPVLPSDGINIGQSSSEVYVYDPDADSYLQVSSNDFSLWNSDVMWHPELDGIMYYSQTEFGGEEKVGIVNLITGEMRGISPFSTPMDLFPDGSKLVVNGTAELFLVDPVTNNILDTTLWSIPSGWQVRDLAVSPNGQNIVVLLNQTSKPSQAWIIDTDGNEDLIMADRFLAHIGWSYDGNWLVYSNGEGVFAMRRDDQCITDVLSLHGIVQDIAWSSGNERLAVAVYEKENFGVYLIDSNSSAMNLWLTSGGCSLDAN